MARPIKKLTASDRVRRELRRRAGAATSVYRDRFRAAIILLRLDGVKVEDVVEKMQTSRKTVCKWSGRFETQGLEGLKDKPGRGRKPASLANGIDKAVTA